MLTKQSLSECQLFLFFLSHAIKIIFLLLESPSPKLVSNYDLTIQACSHQAQLSLQQRATSQSLYLSCNPILLALPQICSILSFCFPFHGSLLGIFTFTGTVLRFFFFFEKKYHLITKPRMSILPKAPFLCIYHKFCLVRFLNCPICGPSCFFCFIFHDSLWSILGYFFRHNSLFLFLKKKYLITKKPMSTLPQGTVSMNLAQILSNEVQFNLMLRQSQFLHIFQLLVTQFFNCLLRNFSTFTQKRKIVNAYVIDYQSLVTTSPGN